MTFREYSISVALYFRKYTVNLVKNKKKMCVCESRVVELLFNFLDIKHQHKKHVVYLYIPIVP
jgi:hypothetical protein